jgi:hypothetical protein
LRYWRDLRVLSLGLVMAVQSVGHAQLAYVWSYQELSSADCIVIAEHLRTNDTGRRTAFPKSTPAAPASELESEFEVLTVLKPCGDTLFGMTLKVRHYVLVQDQVLNGPSRLDVTPGESYLMFLKRIEGSLYEPWAGHWFPMDSTFHVRGLYRSRTP